MVFAAVTLPILLFGVWLMVRNRKMIWKTTKDSYGSPTGRTHEERSGVWITGLVLVIVSFVVFFFGSVLPTAVAWNGQINDRASVAQFQKNQEIYQRKSDDLKAQLKSYLAIQYPNLEQKIFAQIAASPHLLFTLFPQLQSSRTLIVLSTQIINLQSKVYEQETNITQMQKNITVRKNTPWFLNFLL